MAISKKLKVKKHYASFHIVGNCGDLFIKIGIFFPKKQGICDMTLSMKKIWRKKKITSRQSWPLIPDQILLQGDVLAWVAQLT